VVFAQRGDDRRRDWARFGGGAEAGREEADMICPSVIRKGIKAIFGPSISGIFLRQNHKIAVI
jgi:hypothetical protein